jgi:hypothetical protein
MFAVEIDSAEGVVVCWYVPGAGTVPLTVSAKFVMLPDWNVVVWVAWTPFT